MTRYFCGYSFFWRRFASDINVGLELLESVVDITLLQPVFGTRYNEFPVLSDFLSPLFS